MEPNSLSDRYRHVGDCKLPGVKPVHGGGYVFRRKASTKDRVRVMFTIIGLDIVDWMELFDLLDVEVVGADGE
uniref:DUF433 domain-containing protein n=1 Tax=Panagrellus redivivus TaxID=6233 RepID=A0A7E4VMM9_PANRE